MCFTLVGRIQSRLAALIGPSLLAWWFVAATDKIDYWWLFGLMVAVSLIVDVGVYNWLIGYQPRWLSLVLAGAEFWLLKWIVEWPYPLEIRLRTRQALIFYLLAWALSWLTLFMVLPRLLPRWVENNGELYRARRSRVDPRARPSMTLAERRRVYAWTALCLGIVLLPWAVASIVTPSGYVMTALLVNEPGHLRELSAATATAQGRPITSVAGVIGWIAAQGRWPVLPLYQGAWVLTTATFMLGLQTAWPNVRLRHLLGVCMITPWLPCSWLLGASGMLWLWLARSRPQISKVGSWWPFALGLQVSGVALWSYFWLRLATAPLLYLDQGTWQALTWLRQSAPPTVVIAAPGWVQPVVDALGGHPVVDAAQPASLRLNTGADCITSRVEFRHGLVCIVASSELVERP